MSRIAFQNRVVQPVIHSIKQLENVSRLWVAYSGGIDSHVLLHVICMHQQEIPGIEIRAVYINHGLHPQSDSWAEHCRQVCESLGTAFLAIDVDATAAVGESPEAKARKVRYQALEKLVQSGHCLLTAHHQDDQVETMLLQLIRGSGPKGLSAMPKIAPIGDGQMMRPMLDVRRDEVQAYAVHHNLKWINDDSNTDTRFDRNFIRHKVIPVLQQRWPSMSSTVARSAQLCAEAADLLDGIAGSLLPHIQTADPSVLRIEKLKTLTIAEQKNILRYWINRNGFTTPSRIQLQRIIDEVLNAREDRSPIVKWDRCEVRRYRNQLYVMQVQQEFVSASYYDWQNKSRQPIDNLGVLKITRIPGEGISPKYMVPGKVTIRFRTGGESLKPAGRNEHHSLKKLFQELAVPPWNRGRIPLVFIDDVLAAVESVFVDQRFKAQSDEEGFVFHWYASN